MVLYLIINNVKIFFLAHLGFHHSKKRICTFFADHLGNKYNVLLYVL